MAIPTVSAVIVDIIVNTRERIGHMRIIHSHLFNNDEQPTINVKYY